MATKTKKQFITESEQRLAILYFTLSNTAMLHCVRGGDLESGYDQANNDLYSEVGIGLREEREDWEKEVKKVGGPYVFEEWNRVRHEYVK